MPYINEKASKVSHLDIIKNPEVKSFLKDCNYITPPKDRDVAEIKSYFKTPPNLKDESLPEIVIGIDGSNYESSIDDKLPSSKIGYIKIGSLLINLKHFKSLKENNNRFVDPFEVAELKKKHEPNTFTLPSSNITIKNEKTVKDSFRKMVDKHLFNHRTSSENPKTSLRTTLFHLAAIRSGKLGTNDKIKLKIHKCPNCGAKDIEVIDTPKQQYCNKCNEKIYPSDCLRLWEEISEYQSNTAVLSRFMLIIEHLIPIHYMRIIANTSFEALSKTSFIIDGPLAMFGPAAWLSNSIMKYIHEINKKLNKLNFPSLLLIGIQKSGQVVEYTNYIDKFLNNNSLYAIEDNYRYKYIIPNRKPSSSLFGFETYYGQDFIYKTPTGRTFIFALPFPFSSKTELSVDNFNKEKVKHNNYPILNKALALINEFECDLYENAIIPIALAHRYTSISLEPGGRALDLLTKELLASNKTG